MCLSRFISPQRCPDNLLRSLSGKASDLVKKSFEDVDPQKQLDYHTHIAGVGAGNSGAFVNPRMLSWKHPFHRVKFSVYRAACGVTDEKSTDEDLVRRLAALVRNNPFHGNIDFLRSINITNLMAQLTLRKQNFTFRTNMFLQLHSNIRTCSCLRFQCIRTEQMLFKSWKNGRHLARGWSSGFPTRWEWIRRIHNATHFIKR
jgi:hypothetical protein